MSSSHPEPNRSAKQPPWLVILLALGLLWAGLTGLDWLMRFQWFQWHRSFVTGPARPRYLGDAPPLSTQLMAAARGGDLSALLATPEMQARYGIPRTNVYFRVTDEYGLPNMPPASEAAYPVFLVGDSYMLQGEGMDRLPGARLAARIGQPVYTVAHAGRGSVYPLSGALVHPHYKAHRPKVLVWGLVERDITGYFFDSMAVEVMRHHYHTNVSDTVAQPAIQWRNLMPAHLRTALPNTSVLAQMSRRVWTRLRHALWGLPSPDVFISTEPVDGAHLLFYRDSIKALLWPREIRAVSHMRRAAYYANRDYFRPRDVAWIIVLIPDKEQVYRELLPPEAIPAGATLPESCFAELADALREVGVRVVDLLPVFREAARNGQLPYWPDDTHWNDLGMELAAEAMAREVSAALRDGPLPIQVDQP